MTHSFPTRRSSDLLSSKPVNDLIRYTLISNPQYVLEPQLDARARTRLTRLPKGRDPRTIALAQGWKDQGRSDAAIVAAALNMIRTENFVYTLRPPTLGSDSIDEFLFDTRRGFCEQIGRASCRERVCTSG